MKVLVFDKHLFRTYDALREAPVIWYFCCFGFSIYWHSFSYQLLPLSLSGCSGFAGGNILKVLSGKRIGTLFHRDASKWAPVGDVGARAMAMAARESSRRLQVIITE